jgi:hypothetical protein
MQRNKYNSIFSAFIFLLALGFANQAEASHLMGGNITYTYLGGSQYAINLSLFRDCNGISLPSSASLTAASPSCGNTTVSMTNIGGPIVRTPLCPNEIDACDPGPGGTYGVEEWIYRGLLTLPAGCSNANDIVLSWSTCCRNGAITTLTNSGSLYLYATLDNSLVGGNSSPAFNNDPTLYLCSGQENRYNSGMTDVENDNLVYSLVNCKESATQDVSYAGGLSGANPLTATAASINPQTGEVVVIPSTNQVAVICILIEEYRNGVKISEVIRDLQFTVTNCGGNSLPIISGINGTADSSGTTGVYETTACAGEQICFDIQGFDKQAVPSSPFQNLTLDWNFGINGTFVVDYSLPYPVGEFCWTPTQADAGENFFFVEANDDACPFLGSNVYTYKIEVYNEITSDITASTSTNIDSVNSGDTIQLMANINDPNATISWSPATGLSCTDCPNPTFIAVGTNDPTDITYTVSVVSDQGCSTSDNITININGILISTRNIKELSNLNIFPNPITSQSIVEYTLTEQSNIQIELINVIGQKVATIRSENQGSGDYQYNIGNYLTGKAKGMYFLRMTVNGETATKKLMYR